MTPHASMWRKRLVAPLVFALIATMLPLSATAEYGIAPGSAAVVTAGQPLLVRVTPGWNAEVSYEVADGSYVTVWDVAQTAPDGSLWYPVDGGFVPVDGITSTAALEGAAAPEASLELYQTAPDEGVAFFQEAAPADAGWVDPNTGEWVTAAPVETGWTDPNTGEWVTAETAAAPQDGWVDPNTGEWVAAAPAETGWVDPNTGEWVTAAPAETGWVDPNTGEWVEPASEAVLYQEVDPAAEGYVDPNTGEWIPTGGEMAATGEEWVDPATQEAAPAQDGWVDPNTGEWVTADTAAAPVDTAAPQDGWVDPNTGEWITADAVAAPVDVAAADAGWVDPNTGEWVQPAADLAAQPAPTDTWSEPAPVNGVTGGTDSWGEPIATAYIAGTSGDGAACRAEAARGSSKLAVLPEGDAIEVRGEAIGEWQPVNCAGVGGYVNTSLISWEPVATDQGRRGRKNSGGGGGSASGGGMVSFAMQYVGYPYAYAGEGPYAFDCSGFTKFVAQNTLGMDITHDMFTQIGMGQSVNKGELQPGDLVFFSNTFRPGLSHVGIYVGDGQFVHAENESTGVRVSDLNSDYYGSRWAGGTRLA